MLRRSRGIPLLYCITEVRLITFKSATLARFVRISSCTPSAKYALFGSRLRLSKGKTAMDFADEARRKNVEKVTVTATANINAASGSTGFGQRRPLIGRTLTAEV